MDMTSCIRPTRRIATAFASLATASDARRLKLRSRNQRACADQAGLHGNRDFIRTLSMRCPDRTIYLSGRVVDYRVVIGRSFWGLIFEKLHRQSSNKRIALAAVLYTPGQLKSQIRASLKVDAVGLCQLN